MKESPILFSGPLVRALLAGTKTQTRRLMKPQPPSIEEVHAKAGIDFGIFAGSDPADWRVSGPVWAVRDLMGVEPGWRCRYGSKGDRLWVKETWATLTGNGVRVVYRADGEDPRTGWGDVPPERRPAMRWQPSIHMSRRHSRITLEVTEVRVQRLQNISEEDAKAEGVEPLSGVHHDQPLAGESRGRTHGTHPHTLALAVLWDTLNAERDGGAPWSSNPWIWAISFRVLP